LENVRHSEKEFDKVYSKSMFCGNKIVMIDSNGPQVNAYEIESEESGS